MRNLEIRESIKKSKIKMWEVAECYGISDSSFSRMLRYELTKEQKLKIKKIIDFLRKEKGGK